MSFEIDVLIVFADRDNEVGGNAQIGWVSQFKKFLELMLEQVLGEKPNIMLKGEYDSMTSPKLDNAGLLISILSGDFTQSSRCMDHVESFCRIADASPKKLNRVFKVLKEPLSIQQQPARLRELFGYEMYQLDPDSGEIIEYRDYFSPEAERQYWMEITDLCYDLYDTHLWLKKGNISNEITFQKGKTIYLAETSHDLSVQRNIITRELKRLGYFVLPTQSLPGKMEDVERIVQQDLALSSMSIHLIGNTYGDIPEGADRSIQEIQNKLAAEKISNKEKRGEFSRLIWISPDLNSTNERQKRFIETLKRDVESQEGTEILQTLLEDFKNIVREELEDASEKKVLDEGGGSAIYLIHDSSDRAEVKPLIDLIENSGFRVLVPAFKGEPLDLRQKHIENLRNLDSAIIYKGSANEQWVRMKTLDLLKAPGFGRKKPIIAKAIISRQSAIADLEAFRSQNIRFIEGDSQQLVLESLRTFLQECKP
jgi:hypothetical protein